jgi:superfamily II DNA or RNA helicase
VPKLTRGAYDQLVTDALDELLRSIEQSKVGSVSKLRPADAADRVALHVSRLIERALDALPDDKRVEVAIDMARRLVDQIVLDSKIESLNSDKPATSATVLDAVLTRLPDGTPERIDRPLIPLLDTALLTNAPGEPRIGRQIQAEIASADRIDLIMAFIRRSGLISLRDDLRRHTERGKALRVLTTTYTGSTEAEALDLLKSIGAEVRVSYDTSTTRLHAKAWLFHRDSEFSTAYVGSSNLTHSAQVTGLEWNVRVSNARNRAVIEKITAVFESCWQQDDFQPYDREQFVAASRYADQPDAIYISPVEIRLEPFQERLLEQIELSRQQGYHKNLLVSATGTGKTVMAAVDYSRLKDRFPRSRLLFIAHRTEILQQSRATFAHALRDGSFGELWVGGQRPRDFEHVFASIQSLNAGSLENIAPDHFDVVVIDEFHHAAAESYRRMIDWLTPVELLGLTATPERSDAEPILHWFGDRIAAELRLWDAIDQHRLTPFAYYGIADDLDLREIPWRRGTGYDVDKLTSLITGTDVWARKVLKEFVEHVGRVDKVRCLGFCVSVAHAQYMERVFQEHGVKAKAVWAGSSDVERKQALDELGRGQINVVFSVDLFNEGVDLPTVDALLMVRPTESPLLFLQQLGRGLRKSPDKSICTVLDFVGQHRKEFRYDRRFRALLGGSRRAVISEIEDGFPFLPAGCHMELDRVAADRILENIRASVPRTWNGQAAELRSIEQERPGVSLREFLEISGLDLQDIYSNKRSWSDLKEAAGLDIADQGPHEIVLRRACGRLLHVDDDERMRFWLRWLDNDYPLRSDEMSEREVRLLKMLLSQVLDQLADDWTLDAGIDVFWPHPQVRADLIELLDVLSTRVSHVSASLTTLADVPLRIHAQYTRHEILAACGVTKGVDTPSWREGLYFARELPADLFVFTLDKTSGSFSPTTRYRDYAISRDLIHWESQSTTRTDSNTGRRYQNHVAMGSQIFLFARHGTDDRAFYFLGPATYVKHEAEMPMAITWRLSHPLPGDLFASFAAAVA